MKFVWRLVVAAAAVGIPSFAGAQAQDSLSRPPLSPPPDTTPARVPVPFSVGERSDYNVKFGVFSVGRGSMEVLRLDTLRGKEAWHIQYRVRGGVPGFRVDDVMESWMETTTLASLRFFQDLREGSHDRETKFEIYPDSVYVQDTRDPQKTVKQPLDEGSFFYFVRTIPLEVGQEYVFDRYFRPDRNPVRIQVLRRETIQVPAGRFETVVVRPIFKARGVFSEGGRAEVWLTDDSRRLMVQMKSHMKLGSLSLFLRSHTPGKPAVDTSVAR